MRGSVIAAKNLDYVQAAQVAGRLQLAADVPAHPAERASPPVVVIATIALGGYVSAEATLTFLGVGLQAPGRVVGHHDQRATHRLLQRVSSTCCCFPCALLVGTVLSFILAGDALRDALDPKLR